MKEIIIANYSIGIDHALEAKNMEEMKADERLFHLATGEYRDQLVKELWDEVKKIKREPANPKGSTETK